MSLLNSIDNLAVRATSAPWWNGVNFIVLARDKKAIGTNIVMTTVVDSAVRLEPTFTLSTEQAQVLMDDLWMSGLRPSEGTGSAGALAATQKHLEDMRTLVFKERTTK